MKKKWFKTSVVFTMMFSALYPINSNGQIIEKPNIVVIVADDLGWGDVGFHNSEIMTPHLDQLSKDGVILNRFYTAPICSPTRAGLMTGRYPNRFGLRTTVIPPWSHFGLDINEKILPQYLEEAGYENRAAIGKWHLGHANRKFLPLERGFTHFYGHYNGNLDYFTHEREGELDWHNDWKTSFDKGYTTDLITNEATKFIRKNSSKSTPFFLYVAFNAPHSPLQAKEEDLELYGYDKNKPKITGNPLDREGRGNTERQTYSAMVTAMDRGIGNILETLNNLNILDNTVVLFFSDNGAQVNVGGSSGLLRGHKGQEWEGGLRVPAIIKWPNGFEGGRTLNQVTGFVDVLPTFLDIVKYKNKIEMPLDGQSILSELQSGKETDRDFYLGNGALVNQKWKIIKAGEGISSMGLKTDVLFNIDMDPYEKNDLKSNNPEKYKSLLQKVYNYDTIVPKDEAPPFNKGKKDFKAPLNWEINEN